MKPWWLVFVLLGCAADKPTGSCGRVKDVHWSQEYEKHYAAVVGAGYGEVIGHVHPGDTVCEWRRHDGVHYFVNITPQEDSWHDKCNRRE